MPLKPETKLLTVYGIIAGGSFVLSVLLWWPLALVVYRYYAGR